MVFWVMWRSAENIEEKKKTDRRKTWKVRRKKNGENEENQTTTVYIFGFKLYFAGKYSLKKTVLYHQILFTVFMSCRVFETQ